MYSKFLFHQLPAQEMLFLFPFKLIFLPKQSRTEIELA